MWSRLVSPLLRWRVADGLWPAVCAVFFTWGAIALWLWPPSVPHGDWERWIWTFAAVSIIAGIARPELCGLRVATTLFTTAAPLSRALYWVALGFQHWAGRGGRWGPLAIATFALLTIIMALHPPVPLPLSKNEVRKAYAGDA